MDPVQVTAPTATLTTLKTAFSNLDQETYDGLLQSSGPNSPALESPGPWRSSSPAPSRGRTTAPQPIHVSSPLANEVVQKSPTTVFSKLDRGLHEDLLQSSEPGTPVMDAGDPLLNSSPAPGGLNQASDSTSKRSDSLLADSSVRPPLSATFARLGKGLHEDLAQSSEPSTPTLETPNPAHARTSAPTTLPSSDSKHPDPLPTSNTLHSPLSATFSNLPSDLHEDLAQSSEPSTPAPDSNPTDPTPLLPSAQNQKFEHANILLALLNAPDPSPGLLAQAATLIHPHWDLPATARTQQPHPTAAHAGPAAICQTLRTVHAQRRNLFFDVEKCLGEDGDVAVFGRCSYEPSGAEAGSWVEAPFAVWATVGGEGTVESVQIVGG